MTCVDPAALCLRPACCLRPEAPGSPAPALSPRFPSRALHKRGHLPNNRDLSTLSRRPPLTLRALLTWLRCPETGVYADPVPRAPRYVHTHVGVAGTSEASFL